MLNWIHVVGFGVPATLPVRLTESEQCSVVRVALIAGQFVIMFGFVLLVVRMLVLWFVLVLSFLWFSWSWLWARF